MEIENSTCWHNNFCCKKMNEFFDNNVKCNFEIPYHIEILKEQLKLIPKYKLPLLLDIGCGTSSSSLYCNEFIYEGCDLEHIINSCSKRNFPQYIYHIIDIENDDVSFIKNYNVLLLNGIIDVMQHPLLMLNKILTYATDYVIIHRQEISKTKPTHIIKNDSYGGYTYHSIINESDFNLLINAHKFKIINRTFCDFNWENGGDSYLLQKIK